MILILIKSIYEKTKNKPGGLTLTDFEIHYKATVIKMMCSFSEEKKKKNRQIVQRKRNSPEIDPHQYSQLIFDKKQTEYNGAKMVFSTNGSGTTRHTHAKKKKKEKSSPPKYRP